MRRLTNGSNQGDWRTEVDERIERIAEGLRLIHRAASQPGNYLAISRFNADVRKEQNAVALEFGKSREWNLSGREFNLTCLAAGRISRSLQCSDSAEYRLTDHHYCYRIHRRPVAIAAHLYDYADKEPEIIEACARLGLIFEVPKDFPSWWYPGESTLVVYTQGLELPF